MQRLINRLRRRPERQAESLALLDAMASGTAPRFRTYGDIYALVRPWPSAVRNLVEYGVETGLPAFRDPAALAALLRTY